MFVGPTPPPWVPPLRLTLTISVSLVHFSLSRISLLLNLSVLHLSLDSLSLNLSLSRSISLPLNLSLAFFLLRTTTTISPDCHVSLSANLSQPWPLFSFLPNLWTSLSLLISFSLFRLSPTTTLVSTLSLRFISLRLHLPSLDLQSLPFYRLQHNPTTPSSTLSTSTEKPHSKQQFLSWLSLSLSTISLSFSTPTTLSSHLSRRLQQPLEVPPSIPIQHNPATITAQQVLNTKLKKREKNICNPTLQW